jgi:hypothetical protein
VDTIDVYILQNTVMTEFVKLQSIAKTAFTGTTTRTYIVHTDQNGLDALVVLAPLATDNYGPPTDGKFCKWLKSRMFVANADNVYWSQPGNPESFNLVNDYLPVDPDSGTPITGLGLINDYLIIFKSNGIYYLDGDSPQTYRIRLFDSTTGSLNHHSIINADNKLWFVANNGAHMWQGPGSPLTNISATMVKDEFDYVNVDYTDLYKLIGFEHPLQEYVAWVLVPANQTAGANQTIMIPFNYRTNTWMAHRWETIDVRSATVVPDTTNRQWPQLGDYSGTVYQLGTTANDGLHPLIDVDTATVSNIASITSVSQSTIENPDQEEITLGTGDPALADATAITVATKSWPVDVFVGRYMFVYDETTDYKDALRIKIIANSATVLYFEPFDMSTLRGTATVVIGGIQCDMKTPFRAGGSSFYKKRIEYVYTHTSDGSTGVVLDYYMYTNGNGDDYQRKKRVNFAFGSQYDFSQWNVGRFAAIGGEWRRVPFRKIGNNWQSRICHIGNNNRLLLHKLGVQWLTKTKKPGLGEA